MFAEMVRSHRQRRGLSQEELAGHAGLSVRNIRNLESGRTATPRPATVRLLADAFALTGAERETFCQAAADPPTAPPVPTRPRVPAQLPADVAGFTGRAEQLARLDALLGEPTEPPSTAVISAIAGTAGVGKTALAVRWAHQVADRYPDGQLYLDLRGYDPEQPMAPGDALARLLTALGVTGQDLPVDLDDRAARYRSELAGRRLLVVLDNAATVEQVRPLLPGTGHCPVVVTSRDRLAGLVARHGAHRLDLDLLPPADALALLRRLIGARVDAEPRAAAILADQCARLPLALRVAAELAASRPTASLAELVGELADQHRRLQLLDPGDSPHASVTVVFSWSISHLPPAAVRTFRRLGLHPGPDFDAYAAAALAGTGVGSARQTLRQLSGAHLIHPTGRDRYGMHDLLRLYAAELTRDQDPDRPRQAALRRLLDHYRQTASVAMDLAYPYERDRRPRVPPSATATPELADQAQASGWLDADLASLLAAGRYAAGNGWPEHICDLAATLHRHLCTRSRFDDAEALHQLALACARAGGHRAGELAALLGLGYIDRLRGRYPQATDHHRQALDLARTTGNRAGELHAHLGLGDIDRQQGRYPQATDHHRQALDLARTTGNHAGELDALYCLGVIHWLESRPGPAIDHLRRALEIARGIGNQTGELNVLNALGTTYHLLDQRERAREAFARVLTIARSTGSRLHESNALIGLGAIHRRQGRYERALENYRQTLAIAEELGVPSHRFEGLQGLGRVHHAAGHAEAALTHHRRALALADARQLPDDQARAHDGLAHAYHALGQPARARRHWQQALDLLNRLGTDRTEDPEATSAAIRARLAALTGSASVHRMQGTVADFDPERRGGALLLDDGTRLEFGAAAFDASGLRLLRLGQRVQVEQDPDGSVIRVTLPTMR